MKRDKLITACLAACAVAPLASAWAQATEAETPSDAPYSLFGDALEQAAGVKAIGFLQVGVSRNNVTTRAEASGGHSNAPVVGAADEGFQLNAFQLAFERPITTNILPRITPLPGPVPWEFSWGFRADLMYGRNALPGAMFGFDTGWGINRTADGVVPGSNRQNYLAMPQLYAQFYFPVWQGAALTVGRFGSGIGRDIPPPWRPGPSVFYSHTYTLVSQPDQVAGVLGSLNLMRNAYGFAAAELGVVNGRQNWQDNNGSKALTGALHWRSTDMNTWVDYSFMRGNEQNDLTRISAPQMPVARLISPRGQLREHHSLSTSFKPAERWQVSAELVYGKQHGDGLPGTLDVLTFNPALGNFFTGGAYSGVNGQAVYSASPVLRYALRMETFRDRQGVALFPVTAVASDFNAITAGLTWEINKNLILRPEIRHDWQSNNRGVNAFGNGRASRQTTLSADLVAYF